MASNAKTLEQWIMVEAQDGVNQILGKETGPFLRKALTVIESDWRLSKCDKDSILTALYRIAGLGLNLDPVLGQSYLVAYKRKGKYYAQVMIGYKGFLAMMYKTDAYRSIHARCVYSQDQFSYEYGLHEDSLVHKPFEGAKRGKLTHAYAFARLRDGDPIFVVMTASEIAKIRNDSRAYDPDDDNCIWVKYPEAMAMKTTIRQLAKYGPKSTQLERALVTDDLEEKGIDVPDEWNRTRKVDVPAGDDGSDGPFNEQSLEDAFVVAKNNALKTSSRDLLEAEAKRQAKATKKEGTDDADIFD
jgi:phage RecT family recombinase